MRLKVFMSVSPTNLERGFKNTPKLYHAVGNGEKELLQYFWNYYKVIILIEFNFHNLKCAFCILMALLFVKLWKRQQKAKLIMHDSEEGKEEGLTCHYT